jgi:hypothetical protein
MFKRIGDSQDQLFGPCAMPVGPFPIPYLCVQIPGSAMDLPRRHRDIEPVEDCEGMIDAYAGAVQVVLRPGYSRPHFPGQRAHAGVRGSESGCQNIIRLAVSIPNIASLQPGFRHSELGV